MKSIDVYEWADEIYDIDDLGTLEVDTMIRVADGQPLKARQRLELYWEQKRLKDNLLDALSDDSFYDVEPVLPPNARRDPLTADSRI